MTAQNLDTAAACCGKDSWTTAGSALVNSCKLCPSSPTYWRLTLAEVVPLLEADGPACGMTHAEHAEVWRSFRDDCEHCGFAMADVNQCMKGHPDDGVSECGLCGKGTPWMAGLAA